jgi:hypothetical protein
MSLWCHLTTEVKIQTMRLALVGEKEKREIESYIISLQAGIKTCMDEAVVMGMRMSDAKYARKRSKAEKSEKSESKKSEAGWDVVPDKGSFRLSFSLC